MRERASEWVSELGMGGCTEGGTTSHPRSHLYRFPLPCPTSEFYICHWGKLRHSSGLARLNVPKLAVFFNMVV